MRLPCWYLFKSLFRFPSCVDYYADLKTLIVLISEQTLKRIAVSNFKKALSIFILQGFVVSNAFALNTLKQVEMNEDGKINLDFSEKIKESQLSVDYFKDIIQLSFNHVSVFPAKIVPLQGKYLNKVFAYQYSPKLVRCRFFVNGQAESFKDKLKLAIKGNHLSFELVTPLSDDIDEKALLEKVIQDTTNKDLLKNQNVSRHYKDINDGKVNIDSSNSGGDTDKNIKDNNRNGLSSSKVLGIKDNTNADDLNSKEEEPQTLTNDKPLPSIWSAFPKLAFVVLMFIFVAAIVQKIKIPSKQNKNKKSGLLENISRFTKRGFKNDTPLIEVLSTHHLDPKKSIAVVRVAGRTLILGVSNDSINLIAQISNEEGSDSNALEEKIEEQMIAYGNGGALAAGISGGMFSDLLTQEKGKDLNTSSDLPSVGVRSRIKNRLEGLKRL